MSKKTTLISVGCAVMSLLCCVRSYGVESNLAMVQDAQRQISCVHDSIFDEGYREKCDIVNKSPRAYFKVLGYHSSFNGKERIKTNLTATTVLSKDKTNSIGGLFGIEKQFNENWNFGTFTSFQYADCDFGYSTFSPADAFYNYDCSTISAISGLYSRYCKDKWTGTLVGSLGYLTFRNDSSGFLNRNKYRGWSCALSGQISYNLSSQNDIDFGPMVGFDGSYIEEDGYVEFLEDLEHFNKVNDHNVKSLTTFVGAYGKKTFLIKEYKSLAYANAGWSCEYLRNGNKYPFNNENGDYHQANLPYLPRNTAKVRIGIKSFFNERIEGELAVGANFGSDYYNINGNVAINYQF